VPEIGPQFEAVFESLLPEEHEAPAPRGSSPALSLDVERSVQGALRLFAEGLYARCWEALDGIDRNAEGDARATALAAARRSFETGRLVPGIQACLGLLEGRDHLPDLYLVLGVLLLKAKQRAQAYEAFRQGLRLSPGHPALHNRMESMGLRQPPILPFLPRSHRINRALGRARAWLGAPRRVLGPR